MESGVQHVDREVFRRHRRGGLVVIVAIMALVAGCGLGQKSLNEKIADYEHSLRDEAGWLWEKMNYARTHYTPNDAECKDQKFKPKTVKLDKGTRKENPSAATMVDRLDYAAGLIQVAHGYWNQYCAGQLGAPDPAPYLEAQLRAAYDYINAVRVSLNKAPSAPG
jgi:hypothetical protein